MMEMSVALNHEASEREVVLHFLEGLSQRRMTSSQDMSKAIPLKLALSLPVAGS